MKSLQLLLRTNDSSAPLIARLTLGLIMFPHGAQKMLGWFGGYGFDGTMGFFTGTLGIPSAVAFLVILGEFAGSLALIAGLFSRFSAAALGIIMAGAIFMGHLGNGFFMNWSGAQAGEGYEYHLLAIGLALIVTVHGAGKVSIDSLIARRLAANQAKRSRA